MIGKLTGRMDSSGTDWAIVDVSGVGYVVHCSGRGFAALPGQGEPVSLWIETHVREDHIRLYGFPDAAERDWFRLLSTVQGVGARMALAILSVLAPGDLIQAIAAQDKQALTRANGVGPKLAARVVTELKDKAGQFALGPAAAQAGGAASGAAGEAAGSDGANGGAVPLSEDAISALVNLGYQRMEAFGAVAQATRSLGAEAPLEAVIKAGLKELSA
jgi:Holliday junction DNA helicase RuvA